MVQHDTELTASELPQVAGTPLLVGPLPRERIEGVSIAFQTLVTGLRDLQPVVVNTNWLRTAKNPGRLDATRAVESVLAILRVYRGLLRTRTVYAVISTSPLGFARDALMIVPASLLGRRIVVHLHGGGMRHFYLSGGSIRRALMRAVYKRVDTIIVLGERLQGQFRFAKSARIAVVPNALPAELRPEPDIDRQLGSPIRLLYLSNVTRTKGIEDLIRAVAILRSDLDVRLDVCGAFLADVDMGGRGSGDVFEQEVRALVTRLGLQNAVTFRGTVVGDAKLDMLRNSHVFVLPTYYRWEGQPISIIEAQAYGLPVVATDHRAIRDTVVFGQSAERCNQQDAESIATAVRTIVSSPRQYQNYHRASRRNYQDRFRTETHISNMKRAIFAAG